MLRNQSLRRIVFALSDGTDIVDAGRFAPGVTIDYTFDLPPDEEGSRSVAAVTFANGTQWSDDPASRP